MRTKTLWCCLLLLASCRKPEAAPPPRSASTTWDVSDGYNGDEGPAEGHIKAQGLYEGKLPDAAIKASFDAQQKEVLACFQAGKKRNRYIEGDLRLSFEITAEGKPEKLFIASSTLGDDAVEGCFITLVNTMPLPKPSGGTVLAGYTLGYHPSSKPGGSGDPNEEEREKYLLGAKDALKACKKLPESFQAAVWIQPEGKALSAGYSAETHEDQSARECVITALLATKYPKSVRKATYLLFNAEELPALKTKG